MRFGPGRRAVVAGLLGAMGQAHGAWAQATDPKQPVVALYDGLSAIMRMGKATPFKSRFERLAATIDRAFDLDTILRTSVGLRWSSLSEAERRELATVFRDYTIVSYVANFDANDGERFSVLPQTRAAGEDQIVGSQLIPAHGDTVRIDYVMHVAAGAWKVVDVLLDGSISRVAVQRSDFRGLLTSGAGPLIESLKKKVSDLSGGAMSS